MAIGLFGTPIGAQSDQDIVDRARQEQELRNQRLTQNLGKYAGLAASGMGQAQQFQSDVGRIFGIQDQRLQKNTAIREAGDAVKARGVDLQDSLATLTAFSEELMKRGLYQEATALMPQIQQAQRQKAQDMQVAERTSMDRERLGLERERIGIAKEEAAARQSKTAFDQEIAKAELELRKQQQATQGRLTEAQIARTLAEIKNIDSNQYSVSTSTDLAGNVVVTAINKKNPSDIKVIRPEGGAAPAPAPAAGKTKRPPLSEAADLYTMPVAP